MEVGWGVVLIREWGGVTSRGSGVGRRVGWVESGWKKGGELGCVCEWGNGWGRGWLGRWGGGAVM